MTAINNNIYSSFDVSNFDIDVMEAANYRTQNIHLILKVAKFLSVPIIVIKNIHVLLKAISVNKKSKKLINSFEIVFSKANENEKIELYATFSHLFEALSNTINNKGLESSKSDYLAKRIAKNLLEIRDLMKYKDAIYYKEAYPNATDSTNIDFIESIIKAHSNSAYQYHF